jgi:hypothetical protein
MVKRNVEVTMLVPTIDLEFWVKKNPFFSSGVMLPNIKIGLNHAKRGGLIDDVISTVDQMSNDDLVKLIASEIDHNAQLDKTDKSLLRIFDLIQGWGGRMCRGPYVIPKVEPYRLASSSYIANQYKNGLKILSSGNIELALAKLLEIKHLGVSFATKHLYFWGRYGQLKTELPIYDLRIKNLLYGNLASSVTYSQYLRDLQEASKKVNLSISELERALFAFSTNWYLNDKLILVKKPVYEIDREEAMTISSIRKKPDFVFQ